MRASYDSITIDNKQKMCGKVNKDILRFSYFSTPVNTTPLHLTHSTELFKIFFSLLTLCTAFLQKATVRGKNSICYCEYYNIIPLSGQYIFICIMHILLRLISRLKCLIKFGRF